MDISLTLHKQAVGQFQLPAPFSMVLPCCAFGNHNDSMNYSEPSMIDAGHSCYSYSRYKVLLKCEMKVYLKQKLPQLDVNKPIIQ